MVISPVNSTAGLVPATQSRNSAGMSRNSISADSPAALDTVTQIADSLQRSIDALNRTQLYHRQIPEDKAVTSLAVIRNQLDGIDKMTANSNARSR